jgi:hypothetical protein
MRVAVEFDSGGSNTVFGADRYDLRSDPQALERIEPARCHAPLRALLTHLNSEGSPFQTFGCKAWSVEESGAEEAHVFASRVDVAFLSERDNFRRSTLEDFAQRVAQLLESESGAVWAELRVAPASFAAGNTGYCLRLTLCARGNTPQQAEMRWGLAVSHVQQALLFAARALRQ